MNGEGIKFEGGKIGLENYCFYFDNEGIVGIPERKEKGKKLGWPCGNNYKNHLSTTKKEWPKIKHKWDSEDSAKGKKVLLVDGSSQKIGSIVTGSETRNIIGCFDEGWWGQVHQSVRDNWGKHELGYKIGVGYNGSEKEIFYQNGNSANKTAKLSTKKCTNGAFDAITGIKTGWKDITRTYNPSGATGGEWTIKYFEDLTWTLEW